MLKTAIVGTSLAYVPLASSDWADHALTAFNAVQFAFTLLWTAVWITLALLVHALLRDRHWPLRMASARRYPQVASTSSQGAAFPDVQFARAGGRA